MLNCISTIDTVSAGHIYLDGTDVTEIHPKEIARFRRENLGFIFQDFQLLDTLTIEENVSLALTINHVPAKNKGEGARYCTDFKNNRHIGEISVSGFRRTEAEMRLRRRDNPSARKLILADRADRGAGQPFGADPAGDDAGDERTSRGDAPGGHT